MCWLLATTWLETRWSSNLVSSSNGTRSQSIHLPLAESNERKAARSIFLLYITLSAFVNSFSSLSIERSSSFLENFQNIFSCDGLATRILCVNDNITQKVLHVNNQGFLCFMVHILSNATNTHSTCQLTYVTQNFTMSKPHGKLWTFLFFCNLPMASHVANTICLFVVIVLTPMFSLKRLFDLVLRGKIGHLLLKVALFLVD